MTQALSDLITSDRILAHQSAAGWREAIQVAARPLLDDGSITGDYVQAMIEAVDNYGPYIVLGPHVALAHARPERGVNRQAMSLVTLAEPVEFGHADHDPVSVVFCLASTDSHSHLAALKGFVAIAGDRDLIDGMAAAPTTELLAALLRDRS